MSHSSSCFPASPLSSSGASWKDNNTTGSLSATQVNRLLSLQSIEERRRGIKKLFDSEKKVQVLSASSYDTAWVAMIPSPAASTIMPCFPECVNWILENQQSDGSWGLQAAHERDPLLLKDTLSSTLACILALNRWGIADQHTQNALGFIEQNSGSLMDSSQQTPIGFNIIFPAMIETCIKDYNLNLPLKTADIDAMLRDRDLALNSSTKTNPRTKGHNAYFSYISEGIGDLQDWESAMKFQRKNGSLFNSPAATAAAFVHLQDRHCLRYLRSVVNLTTGKNAGVPAIYPHSISTQLCLIDTVENLGLARHFREEIKVALDEIYRSWEHGEEDIFLDCTTCAMAFRILRLNGYPVSPDVFNGFTEDRFWNDTMEGYLKDERAVLELHKAASVVYPEEPILEQQHSWTRQFLLELRQDYSESSHHHHHHKYSDHYVNRRPRPSKSTIKQMLDVLDYPFHVDLEPSATKRNIEKQYFQDTKRILKSSFSCANFGGQDFLKLAVEDFNLRQSIYSHELKHMMSWLEEKKIDKMKFAKMKTGYCYFNVVAIISDPELRDARFAFTQYAVLASLVDDLFDIFGTPEEQLNLVHFFERWDVDRPRTTQFCSEQVETLYWAIHDTICETVEKALAIQGRSVMDHMVELWLDLLKGMLEESEWCRTSKVPTLEEYMANGSTTIAIGAFLVPTLYLSGYQLSEEVVRGSLFQELLNMTSICGRLLNDIRSFQREAEQGESNTVLLLMNEAGLGGGLLQVGESTAKEALEEIEKWIKGFTQDLLRLALDEKDEGVPGPVKDMFWELLRTLHMFYQKEDLYHASTKLINVVESIINQPISLASIVYNDL